MSMDAATYLSRFAELEDQLQPTPEEWQRFRELQALPPASEAAARLTGELLGVGARIFQAFVELGVLKGEARVETLPGGGKIIYLNLAGMGEDG
jgi:hypothetical protein